MGRFNSILRNPKKEEQQDSSVPDLLEINGIYQSMNAMDEIDIMEELENIWGVEDEDKLVGDNMMGGVLERDFLDWDEFPIDGEHKDTNASECPEDEQVCYNISDIAKREVSGYWDEDEESMSMNLKLSLNYQAVMDAWSDQGSLWADDCSLSTSNNNFMGEVPVMQQERTRREARVLRYKEKRQNRLFSNSKKIRYQVRKINAENRPRLKGRFVKRAPD